MESSVVVLVCLAAGCGRKPGGGERASGGFARAPSADMAPGAPAPTAAGSPASKSEAEAPAATPAATAATADDGDAAEGGTTAARPIRSGTLTAGDIDDNLNFEAFTKYATRFTQAHSSASVLPAIPLSDRVTFHVTDSRGTPVGNARVSVAGPDGKAGAFESYAGTNGVFRLFPAADGLDPPGALAVTISAPDGSARKTVNVDLSRPDGGKPVKVVLEGAMGELPSVLDLMLVIDATGSMSDEMKYLAREFTDIVRAVRERFSDVGVRFGLIVYRDRGDEYVVRRFPFTGSVKTMQEQLLRQRAQGGGNYPEAMDQAMAAAMKEDWRAGNAARVLFLVADAPPHDDGMAATVDSFKEARRRGIRVHPVAASGVGDKAEYVMRHGAVLSGGRYLFITDDSGVGHSHKEPSIPGYVVTRLDRLMARVIAGELAGERVEPEKSEIIRTVGYYEDGYVVPRDAE